MAKKRKTLPKNFGDLITAKDIPALKAVFDTCEIWAYEGFNKETALHFYNVPDELARWLVERGLDINVCDHYERTPLHRQATIGSDSVNVLLELGADMQAKDKYDAIRRSTMPQDSIARVRCGRLSLTAPMFVQRTTEA
jgi:ankyrin repeat protein